MALERTLSIIKPDATARNLTGAINAMIEQAGLRIVAQKRVRITKEQAEAFYAVHKARPFFGELVDFIHEKFPDKKKVAFIYVNDDFGKGGFDGFKRRAEPLGFKIVT